MGRDVILSLFFPSVSIRKRRSLNRLDSVTHRFRERHPCRNATSRGTSPVAGLGTNPKTVTTARLHTVRRVLV
jgi:hypothetical protein